MVEFFKKHFLSNMWLPAPHILTTSMDENDLSQHFFVTIIVVLVSVIVHLTFWSAPSDDSNYYESS